MEPSSGFGLGYVDKVPWVRGIFGRTKYPVMSWGRSRGGTGF